ncbi:glycosyltransferase [Nonomuraea longicatena]|uniref:Glycosyltransferase n=1 Tax=Nonomuraea longicatena TaxID=83682 RepID=A0ABN1PFF0_9ACTN
MRVCVATTDHHPEDARIMHRQIRALLDAGHDVAYVAPFTYYNVTPPPPITAIDLPRGAGHGRARAALRRGVRDADLLLVHDARLMRAVPYRCPPVVWDVREPRDARRAVRAARRHHVISPEVVPEATTVAEMPPPSGDARVVHLGRLTAERGAGELVGLAERLVPYGLRLDLIGPADHRTRVLLRDAQRAGLLDWYGHVPHRHALRMTEGALAGLSLAADSVTGVPTKVLDYMGRGIPVVATAQAAQPVRSARCGLVVRRDPAAVLEALLDLREDPALRAELGANGHRHAALHHHWPDHARTFVARMESYAELAHPVVPQDVRRPTAAPSNARPASR